MKKPTLSKLERTLKSRHERATKLAEKFCGIPDILLGRISRTKTRKTRAKAKRQSSGNKKGRAED